jgi:hypothetical protein
MTGQWLFEAPFLEPIPSTPSVRRYHYPDREVVAPQTVRLLLSATRSSGLYATGCNFQASIDGSPFTLLTCTQPGQSILTLSTCPEQAVSAIQRD